MDGEKLLWPPARFAAWLRSSLLLQPPFSQSVETPLDPCLRGEGDMVWRYKYVLCFQPRV